VIPQPFAIVTGASSCVGLEYSKCCTRYGLRIVIAVDETGIEAGATDFRRLADVRALQSAIAQVTLAVMLVKQQMADPETER
jgi:NAD(P)-dependent dehydrogenase (short-subunit alcohol dehydrogenase family)